MVPLRYDLFAAVVAVAALVAGIILTVAAPNGGKSSAETIYVLNDAPQYISDRQIRRDIPSWEQAASQFSASWDTPQVSIRLVSKAPADGITAVFRRDGPVQGALAYHSVFRGVPGLVVYAGVGDFYGYSNSVSFTHELFELLADQNINAWSFHWQSSPGTFYIGKTQQVLPANSFWFREVCDPVEAFAYSIDHIQISDWVTPNWFNEQVNGPYDYMSMVHQPFTVLRGGYAQFFDGTYNLVQDFHHAGRDAAGFEKGEQLARS